MPSLSQVSQTAFSSASLIITPEGLEGLISSTPFSGDFAWASSIILAVTT